MQGASGRCLEILEGRQWVRVGRMKEFQLSRQSQMKWKDKLIKPVSGNSTATLCA